jgi:hypothetical protein
MQNDTPQTKTPKKRIARSPKITVPYLERAVLSPNEFAAVCGKQTSWGYRRIYAGDVKVIRSFGRMMVPVSEVKRLLATAEVFA